MPPDPGAGFAFCVLLDPLPTHTFHTIVAVCRENPEGLVLPFVAAALQRGHGLTPALKTIQNVMWKLCQYLPSALAVAPTSMISPGLKSWQELVPDANTVRIETARNDCFKCRRPLAPCKAKDRSSLASFRGPSTTIRFKLFSAGAGVQHAEFVERRCCHCNLYFLGGWMYHKNVGPDGKSNFGKPLA